MNSKHTSDEFNQEIDYQEHYENVMRYDVSAIENFDDAEAGTACRVLRNLVQQAVDSLGVGEKLYPVLGTCGRDFCIEIYTRNPNLSHEIWKNIYVEIAPELRKVPFSFGDLTGTDATIVVPDAAHMLALVKITESLLRERIEVRDPLDGYGNELINFREAINSAN